ncbi:MAG: alpha-L-fucosidase [Kiritimatiellae bacterium]|nr:alpha-L-fucosidase [Kiritimatiellia bacterium]
MDGTKWFSEARFGMFIHWGLPSLLGRGEWVMYQENIPTGEYNRLACKFNPRQFDAGAWVALAQEAGMKYMVHTTKHHDGFCMFDSQETDFTSAKTAAGRDIIGEFVNACHKANMKVGLYFSLPDWQWPVFFKGPEQHPQEWVRFREFIHAQVRELCTNYGRIDLLWFDMMVPRGRKGPYTPEDWGAGKLIAMIRRLQPHILINNRTGLPEDFDTPEQHCAASKKGRLWEACMTMNLHWGYHSSDHLWKYSKEMLHLMTGCASAEGNYLLNVGPQPDGTIPVESVKRLREIGRWMKVNGEAIYGSQRADWDSGTAGVVTRKGKKDYLIVHWWPGTELALPAIPNGIRSAYMLATGKKVKLERRGRRLILTGLPAKTPDEMSTVIVMRH